MEPCIIVIDSLLQESDKEERVCEALASMLTKSFADYSGLANDQVYNPKEVTIWLGFIFDVIGHDNLGITL